MPCMSGNGQGGGPLTGRPEPALVLAASADAIPASPLPLVAAATLDEVASGVASETLDDSGANGPLTPTAKNFNWLPTLVLLLRAMIWSVELTSPSRLKSL